MNRALQRLIIDRQHRRIAGIGDEGAAALLRPDAALGTQSGDRFAHHIAADPEVVASACSVGSWSPGFSRPCAISRVIELATSVERCGPRLTLSSFRPLLTYCRRHMYAQNAAIAEQMARIQSIFQTPGQVECDSVATFQKRLAFDPADAMLGADRAAIAVDDLEDRGFGISKELLHRLGSIAGRRHDIQMDIAVADMAIGDRQRIRQRPGKFSKGVFDKGRKAGDRHGNIGAQDIGRRGLEVSTMTSR